MTQYQHHPCNRQHEEPWIVDTAFGLRDEPGQSPLLSAPGSQSASAGVVARMVRYDVVCTIWRGVMWHGVMWRGVAWHGVAWCDVIWCGVVWCGVVWCCVLCGVSWGDVVLSRASSGVCESMRPPACTLCTHTRSSTPRAAPASRSQAWRGVGWGGVVFLTDARDVDQVGRSI